MLATLNPRVLDLVASLCLYPPPQAVCIDAVAIKVRPVSHDLPSLSSPTGALPDAPTSLNILQITNESLLFLWIEPVKVGNPIGVLTYQVAYRVAGDATMPFILSDRSVVLTSTGGYTMLTNLVVDTLYEFSVSAVTQFGVGVAATTTAATLPAGFFLSFFFFFYMLACGPSLTNFFFQLLSLTHHRTSLSQPSLRPLL